MALLRSTRVSDMASKTTSSKQNILDDLKGKREDERMK